MVGERGAGIGGGAERRADKYAYAPAASLAMTAVYHAGYSDFRSEKMGEPIGKPSRARRTTGST